MSSVLIGLARRAAQSSEDRSTQVGCVIVTRAGETILGANRFPAGVDRAVEERHARPEKYLWIEHAERNAIYEAAREGISLAGARIGLTWFPCMDCARAIVQAGIVELVALRPDFSDARWQFDKVLALLTEAGVRVVFAAGAA